MKKILEVKNITKIYKIYKNNFYRLKELFTKKTYHKEFISNDSISFDLYEGETLGIIGVNGAGKSTILKIIAGVTTQTGGEIIRHGRVTALLELGTGFHEQLSGYENIFLNGTLIGMSQKECEERAEEIMAFSELGDYINEAILTYSSGMKMRLAFSIAIFSKPQVLIVDEALSVGDAHFGAKCTKALRERKEQNMSIIYVSHDLNSLKLLCDRVLLLNHGKIVEQGNPEDVINTYNFLISKLNDQEDKKSIKDSQNLSFGTFEIEIISVSIKGELSNSNVISSGEMANLEVKISSNINIPNMTVGIMLRDKFGQDIFGTNTYHHKLNIDFKANKEYICNYKMPLNIGSGKYSITAAVHSEDTHLSNCSHWIDRACEFEVAGIVGEQFVGLCNLHPQISCEEVIK
ncbi:MAG: ABC transporter [Sulfurimonas sp. RIFOXYD2_FULL_37_8]|nr:MAG: ABC transporter [Sulfurimonas sp. RIFOXYD2_FULL_37_8]